MTHSLEPHKIVIDLGNSRAKAAIFCRNELTALHTIEEPTPEKLRALNLDRHNLKAGIISSVAGDPGSYMAVFPDLPWIELNASTPIPIKNNYQTPETLGKDRLAGVVAAHLLMPGLDLLIIDAGTALTFDQISRAGIYSGGSISPGMSMRFKALHTFTNRLPLLNSSEIDYLTGRNTQESILSGVINGIRAEIDGIIDEYRVSWPEISVILTGGDAYYFEKILKNNIFAFPNLVLTGLKLILDYNFEK
ncbi:MAG: type III pantothenate kinase [Bacteroidetes bacterium]|nr:MAG: type III pantothenate kinase [Bacteroidota bacterium]